MKHKYIATINCKTLAMDWSVEVIAEDIPHAVREAMRLVEEDECTGERHEVISVLKLESNVA